MRAARAAPQEPIPPSRWSRAAVRGSLWGMRVTVWCYRRLGYAVCWILVQVIAAYFFATDRRGRRASRRYLRRVAAVPEGARALGRPPDAWAGFLRYRAFALSILDRLAIWSGRADHFRFDSVGNEIFDELAAQGRGAIVLGAHLGSFDALRLLAERQRRCVYVLMYTAHAQRINRIFRELSSDAALRVIEIDPRSVRSAFAARARVQRGELITILADRVEPGDRGRVSRVPFLGDEVELPRAPFLLASLLACPVLLMLGFRAGRGHYEVVSEVLGDGRRLAAEEREKGVTELLTAYAGRLEHYCLKHPYQWFNFYDYWEDDAAG